jgi:putative acetyltransferase
MLIVKRENPDQADVLRLLAKADERSSSLYPVESRHGLSLSALVAAQVRFFMARRDGYALGCGGYIFLPERSAEMKRLFVDADARGQGIGGAIVGAIEEAVAKEDIRTLFLETGIKSNEAIRLYKRFGFTECGPFAHYQPDPLSVFMVKLLD